MKDNKMLDKYADRSIDNKMAVNKSQSIDEKKNDDYQFDDDATGASPLLY